MVTRMSVTVDDSLVEEVRAMLDVTTKSEAIRVALEELRRRRRLTTALGNAGRIALAADQTALAALREEP
ncbi:MAG: type II toxin-antitoxin system VapB family antitoxin [Deltaproteobacteria bacterium]|nr:type II toxin-antitoxin system VapB family antitoxin [Deltaproteobacteria bacterium]